MFPYQVVIFDFDGTLCATEEAILYTFQKTFEQEGITPPTPAAIKLGISTGANLSTMLPMLYPELSNDLTGESLSYWITTYRKMYDQEGVKRTTLFEGAHDLLQRLQKQNVQCVVLSNKGQQAIEDALEHFQISDFFEIVIGDSPARPFKKKPDPMAFHTFIQPRYPDLPHSQFLMVGDTDADLLFARHANIDSCWASYGYGQPELCQRVSPTYTVQHLSELMNLRLPNS